MLHRSQASLPAFLADLAAVVSLDSGSNDRNGVNLVADWVTERLQHLGFSTERNIDPTARYGDVVVGRRIGTGSRKILLFAHLDTVFNPGDARRRPFVIDESGIAHGPGVTDDKAGVIAGLHAAMHLIESNTEHYGELLLVFTPDEEIGSPFGGPHLERLAAGADVALCLECARENGDLVVARKGVLDLEITVQGVGAHSGIEPDRGAHAGLEAAHLVIFLQALANQHDHLTVNVGTLRSGERTNIIPDRAVLQAEIRSTTRSAIERTVALINERAMNPVVAGTSIQVLENEYCLPMEATEESARLANLALALASDLGLKPGLAHTGGVSDANRVAALGIPTLDGLGPVGGADHTPEEWLSVASIPQRVALLASLIHSCATVNTVRTE